MPVYCNSRRGKLGTGLACLLALAGPTIFAGQPAVAGVPNSGNQVQSQSATPVAPGATKKLVGGVSTIDHRTLDRGPLFLAPLKDTIVETPFGSVFVAAHSVVLLVVSEPGLALYNLHDNHGDAVIWKFANQKVALNPGRMLAMEKSSVQTFAEANPAPVVLYRGVSCRNVGDEHKLYEAEFQVHSLIARCPALRKTLSDRSNSEGRKDMNGMVKTSAILFTLNQGGEPFGYYITPKVRAISAAATEPQQAH